MNLHRLLQLISFVLLSSNFISAQITIGSGAPPVDGAILQLKQNENKGANSTKGLALPRLQLAGHNLDSISIKSDDTPEMYVGLTVWNIRGVGDICKGVNIWTGTRWQSIFTRKDQTRYDASTGILMDHEGNTYPTGEFEEAGRWMTTNLRTKSAPGSCEDVYYPDELTREQFRDNMELKIMMYPNGKPENKPPLAPASWSEEQGMLYSWALATNGKGGGDGRGNVDNPDGSNTNIEENKKQQKIRQGICPDGWHLPSLVEWQQLFAVIQRDATSTATDKYADYSQANPSNTVRGGGASIRSNIQVQGGLIPNGASKSARSGGFEILLTGYKMSQDLEAVFGTEADFWTASTSIENAEGKSAHGVVIRPRYVDLIEDISGTGTTLSSRTMRTALYSVRCKQNEQ